MKTIILLDDFNQRIPKEQSCIGTITCNIGSPTPRNGFKIIEVIYEQDSDSRLHMEESAERSCL